jgi:hypothetical protein
MRDGKRSNTYEKKKSKHSCIVWRTNGTSLYTWLESNTFFRWIKQNTGWFTYFYSFFIDFLYLYKTSEVFDFYMVRQSIDYSARLYSFLLIDFIFMWKNE